MQILHKVAVIARFLNLTERRVQQLARDGIIPKPEKGKYDLVRCVQQYVQYLQDRAYGSGVSAQDTHHERARLIKAQADKTELEVATMRNQLVAIESVETDWLQHISACRMRLLALPTKTAFQIAVMQEPAEIERFLKHSIYEALVARCWFRDGEVLVKHIEGTNAALDHGTAVPYSLELIEADYLPFDYTDDKKRIIHGVEKNAWRRPRAYYLYKEHPGDKHSFVTRQDTKRYPAEKIIHLKITDRIAQTRGVSIFASVMTRMEDIKDYELSERLAAKVAASICAYVRKNLDAPTNPQSVDAAGNRLLKMQPGMIFDNLLPGEEIGMIDSNRPNAMLEQFRNSQLRAVAAGTSTSYSSISKDYNGTYSAQRQELVEQSVHYGVLRDHFIERCVRPIGHPSGGRATSFPLSQECASNAGAAAFHGRIHLLAVAFCFGLANFYFVVIVAIAFLVVMMIAIFVAFMFAVIFMVTVRAIFMVVLFNRFSIFGVMVAVLARERGCRKTQRECKCRSG